MTHIPDSIMQTALDATKATKGVMFATGEHANPELQPLKNGSGGKYK